jgi:hypothetical protein
VSNFIDGRSNRLGVADADLEVAFAVFAAAYEG